MSILGRLKYKLKIGEIEARGLKLRWLDPSYPSVFTLSKILFTYSVNELEKISNSFFERYRKIPEPVQLALYIAKGELDFEPGYGLYIKAPEKRRRKEIKKLIGNYFAFREDEIYELCRLVDTYKRVKKELRKFKGELEKLYEPRINKEAKFFDEDVVYLEYLPNFLERTKTLGEYIKPGEEIPGIGRVEKPTKVVFVPPIKGIEAFIEKAKNLIITLEKEGGIYLPRTFIENLRGKVKNVGKLLELIKKYGNPLLKKVALYHEVGHHLIHSVKEKIPEKESEIFATLHSCFLLFAEPYSETNEEFLLNYLYICSNSAPSIHADAARKVLERVFENRTNPEPQKYEETRKKFLEFWEELYSKLTREDVKKKEGNSKKSGFFKNLIRKVKKLFKM